MVNHVYELIDTHCHLDFERLRQRYPAIVDSAEAAGVVQMVVPGVTASGWSQLWQFCQSDHRLFPAFGLHPCFMADHDQQALAQLPAWLKKPETRAVGEIGLDFFMPDADREAQLVLLKEQLRLAQRYELPVLLHVRKAHDQMLKELRRFALERGGIVHAFSGSLQQAQQYIGLGFRLGFGGTLSYDRARKLRTLVTELPLESIVLETDAPDMPLAHWRDQPNEPARVSEIAAIVAQLRGISIEEVAAVTTATARKVLALPSPGGAQS